MTKNSKPMKPDDYEPLSPEWRLSHVQCGDDMLLGIEDMIADLADDELDDVKSANAMVIGIQIAQAHYTAANVRARPLEKTEVPEPEPTFRRSGSSQNW